MNADRIRVDPSQSVQSVYCFRFLPLLGLLFLLIFPIHSAHAQENDSLRFERLISGYGRSDFPTSARALLRHYVERDQADQGVLLLDFMQRRKGTAGWLSPEEELLAHLLFSDVSRLLDTAWIRPRLARRALRPGSHGIIADDLYERLLGRLRRDPEEMLRRIERGAGENAERGFLHLLVNNLSVRGVRSVDDVNGMVEQFLKDHPESSYAPLARGYLFLRTDQELIGGGLFAGYASGGVVFAGSDIPGSVFGPSFSGELYVDRFVLSGSLFAGVLSLSDSFEVGRVFWRSGDAALTGGSLDAGYEFRFGNLMLTPFVGGTLYELREPNEEGNKSGKGMSTGGEPGFQTGVMLGWRIPFDVPPHIDLRLRLSLVQPGLSDFSSALDGSIFLATLSFGLIQRPYNTLPAAGYGD